MELVTQLGNNIDGRLLSVYTLAIAIPGEIVVYMEWTYVQP